MDSDNNQNLRNNPAAASDDASGARIRTQSECSVTSDDGNAPKLEKKRLVCPIFLIPCKYALLHQTKNHVPAVYDTRVNVSFTSKIRVVRGNNASCQFDERHGFGASYCRRRQFQIGAVRARGKHHTKSC